jgi:hypothetical protein
MSNRKPKPERPSSASKTEFSVFGKSGERDIDVCARIWSDLDEKEKGHISYSELKTG